MLLPIRTQGFPSLINQLGIQSPLQGPFWGFESTIVPVYEIGSSSVKSVGPPAYRLEDSDTRGMKTAPLAIDTLALIGSLNRPAQRGFYAYHIRFWWVSTGAHGTNIFSLQFWDQTKTIARQNVLFGITGGTTVPPASGSETYESVQEFVEDGDFGEINMAMDGGAGLSVYVATKWRFLGVDLLP